jgi:acyl-coenzyme A thioesterase PaaI-like protein
MLNDYMESHAHCLMCGSDNPWSLKLDFKADDVGEVHAVFKAHEKLQGYADVLHGGIISALLDAAMTHCMFNQGIQAVTAELRVRFLKPVPWNQNIDLMARIEESSSLLYRLYAELKQNGNNMAWAQGKFMKKPRA